MSGEVRVRRLTCLLAVVVFTAIVGMHFLTIRKLDALNAELAQMVRDLKETPDAD